MTQDPDDNIFSSTPSACPSTLSETLYQMGAEVTPTESELTRSNYSDAHKDHEERGDVTSDVKNIEEGPSGKRKAKRCRLPHELIDISRHEGDCH